MRRNTKIAAQRILAGMTLLLVQGCNDAASESPRFPAMEERAIVGADHVLSSTVDDGAEDAANLPSFSSSPPAWSLGIDLPPVEGDCADGDRAFEVTGRMFADDDISERSEYTQGRMPSESGLEPSLRVVGADPHEYSLSTCDDGSYALHGLGPGTYLVYPELDSGSWCTTRNCPSRFVRTLAETGRAVILTFGDSIAVLGSRTRFPQRLAALFGGLGTISSRNMAMEGTTSGDWLPGGWLFDARLSTQLSEADLILITLGGNDILYFVNEYLSAGQGLSLESDLVAALDEARVVIDEVLDNLMAILGAIRMANEDADVAFLLYMNYTQALNDPLWNAAATVLGRETLAEVLEGVRAAFPADDPHLMLVDLFGRMGDENISPFLADPLHLNDVGHIIYAEEIFRTLGGVLLGPSPLGELGSTPIGLRRRFGVQRP